MDCVDGHSMEHAAVELPRPNISSIKNKQRRSEAFRNLKIEKAKLKKKEKKRQQQEAKAMGDKAPPKKVPKTIENMRVYDETMVNPEDEEVNADEAADEIAPYFNRETSPKILITTCDKPTKRTNQFCQELKRVFPNSTYKPRKQRALKKVIPQALKHDFTDMVVINEDNHAPNGMILTHLPDGPTVHFKVSKVKFNKEIRKSGAPTCHHPEVILNNFNTRLGHSVGRLLASLFPHDPQFNGRRVATFHNQRDFIFFRHHRYQFRNGQRVGLQELGPRFTLKLRSLQKGTFDSKYGEYEWVHKRHEMETSRRKFFL